MVIKKKKASRGSASKSKASKPEGNGIPAPLPHSRIDYSKFDYIEDSDEDEGVYPAIPPRSGCNCPQCTFKRVDGLNDDGYHTEDEDEDGMWVPGPEDYHGLDKEQGPTPEPKASKPGGLQPAAQPKAPAKKGLKQNFFASGPSAKPKVDNSKPTAGKPPLQGSQQPDAKQGKATQNKADHSDDDDAASLPPLVSDDGSYDIADDEDSASYTSKSSNESEEAIDVPYSIKGARPDQVPQSTAPPPPKAAASSHKGPQPEQPKAREVPSPEIQMTPEAISGNVASMFYAMMGDSIQRAKASGLNGSKYPITDKMGESIKDVSAASKEPWPGVQEEEQEVKRFAYSVANGSISQEMADEITMYGIALPAAETLGSYIDKATASKDYHKKLFSSYAKYLEKGLLTADTYELAKERADKNFKDLLEEEAQQKREEQKRQEERDEAKRIKRKQKQQRKKERNQASPQETPEVKVEVKPESTGKSASQGKTASSFKEADANPTTPISSGASSSVPEQSNGPTKQETPQSKKAARKKAKSKAQAQGQGKAAQATSSTSSKLSSAEGSKAQASEDSLTQTSAQDGSDALSVQRSQPQNSSQRPSEQGRGEANSPASPSSSQIRKGPGAGDTEAGDAESDEEADSSNPFSILLNAREAALQQEPRGATGMASSSDRESKKPAQERLNAAAAKQSDAVNLSLKEQWQKHPIPTPSGYAPGPLVAQATGIWSGLEEAIEEDVLKLSTALVKGEAWLSTQGKSKVFANFNAELRIRIEQAKQILKQRGVPEPAVLVRPTPSRETPPPPTQTFRQGPPLRPVPHFSAPRPQQGRGPGAPYRPYGRGRGVPPPAYMATGQPSEQWEATSVADLDPFGGVPNRASLSSEAQLATPPAHSHFGPQTLNGPPGHTVRQTPYANREHRFGPPAAVVGRGRPIPPKAMPRPAVPAATLNMPAAPAAKLPSFAPPIAPSEARPRHIEEDESLCCICLEWPPEIILQPCGHNNMCEKCAHNVKNLNEGLCPECRCKIEAIIKPR